MLELGRDRADKPVADAREILLRVGVVDQRELPLDIIRGLLPELDIVASAVFILWNDDPRRLRKGHERQRPDGKRERERRYTFC